MKILQVYKDYYPPVKGGIESHINLLSNGLKDRGIDVQVLVSNNRNKQEIETINGIRITKAPQLGRFVSAPLTPTFKCYLQRLGKSADIIHFHHPNPTAEFSYLFSNLNKKTVVTYHSDIIRQDKLGRIYSPFRSRFLHMADRIIATSPNYITSSGVLKHFRDKCSIIPLGIDTRRFDSAGTDIEKIESIRRKYDDLPIILFVGCFRYYKGLHFLISSMGQVNGKLILIGNGPEYNRLRTLTKSKHLGPKIDFLGELSNEQVNAYYKACDIFVLPSHLRSEAFGLVQLEAMCCRKPVISTDLGTGTSYVNINEKTGLTVNPGDVDALSKAINDLIKHPDKRKKFGEMGFQRVKSLFTADVMVDSILGLYRRVLKGGQNSKTRFISKTNSRENNSPKIKVMRVVSRLNIGGPSIHVKNLTESMDSNKFSTKLVTGTISPDEGDMSYITQFKDNVHVSVPELQREIHLFKDFVALLKVAKLIRSFQPDIVHSHTSKAGTVSRIATIICNSFYFKNIVIIHTFHGNVLYGYFGRLKSIMILLIEKTLAFFTDRVIAISTSQKWELSSVYKICNPDKIQIIKLGFELYPFLNAYKYRGRLREKLSVSDDTLLIGIIGRMVPIKNHKMFIDSATFLSKESKDKKIKFILVGDGELRPSLEASVAASGLKDDVIFYGWEKNIPYVYADLDILALTSINEGTPVSIIEAMAARVPVVTTGVGGVKDLLGDYDPEQSNPTAFKICKRGILCPKDDAHSFYHALRYMIESKYLSDNERFLKAQTYVVENYSVDRLVRNMETLYNQLLNKPDRY